MAARRSASAAQALAAELSRLVAEPAQVFASVSAPRAPLVHFQAAEGPERIGRASDRLGSIHLEREVIEPGGRRGDQDHRVVVIVAPQVDAAVVVARRSLEPDEFGIEGLLRLDVPDVQAHVRDPRHVEERHRDLLLGILS